MKTLNLNRTINGAGDLSDGLIIAICLKNMFVKKPSLFYFNKIFFSSDSNHFNATWIEKLRLDAGDNYRIKV
jgi:hypothetical protein